MQDDRILSLAEVQKLTTDGKKALRYRIQTDPLYLLNNILRTSRQQPLVQGVHDVIASVFPKPNPFISWEHWSSLKGPRIYLGPRKVGKSTVGCACFASAILADADATILILSGESSLAESLCRKIQLMILHPIVQTLFPEYRPTGKKPKIDGSEYWCPARSRDNLDRDATISASTFWSVKAGHHPNLAIWFDDCTNEINSSNEETIAKTVDQWRDCDPLLLPGGYQIFTGTRYANGDLPAVMLEESERDMKISGIRSHLHVCQPVWTVRTDGTAEELAARQEREQTGSLTRNDVTMLLERLDTPELWKQYRQHPKQFLAQMLLCPEAAVDKTQAFPPGLLKNCTAPEMLPFIQYEIFGNFDLSGTGEMANRDSTAGVIMAREILTGRNPKGEAIPLSGRFRLIDGTLGRFASPEALAAEIVMFFQKWDIKLMRLESAVGAKYLEPEIVRQAEAVGITNVRERLVFSAPSNKPDAKRKRVLALALLMKSGVLTIYENFPFLAELHKQLGRFSAAATPKLNDLADSFAQCVQMMSDQPLPEIIPAALEIPPFEDIPEPFPRADRMAADNEESAARYAQSLLNPYA
jgi:hypothetical protein